jgi:hypothetical protein
MITLPRFPCRRFRWRHDPPNFWTVPSIPLNGPAAPIARLPPVQSNFQLARAAAQEDGRVGADPSQIVKAAE